MNFFSVCFSIRLKLLVKWCLVAMILQAYLHSFENFKPLSITEVKCLISKSNSTSCNLDPMPTSLVKKSVHELAPIIQCIMNKSFQKGIFPDSLKYAIVHPLIKDCKLDPDILKNYRPITNLKFIGKTVERAAVSQIQQYVCDNDLQSSIQSAYRPFHSCETAVLKGKSSPALP